MKRLLLLVTAAACVAGCGDSEKVAPQVALNPGGAPRDAKEKATMDAHRAAGEKSNQEMAEAAKQRADAMAKSGGK